MSNVTLVLSKDEALVLFELLSRFSEEERLEIVDKSEEQVLWNMQCSLEKLLTEPFRQDCISLLEESRKKLRYE